MADQLKPKDFYWTWREDVEWPTFWKDEEEAKQWAEQTARDNPGVQVYIGTLSPAAKASLPAAPKIQEIGGGKK